MNESFRILPEAASRSAGEVDLLSLTLLGIATIFSAGIAMAIVFFAVRYWHTRDVNREVHDSVRGHWVIEIFWATVPLLILLVIFWWGMDLYLREHKPPTDAIEVSVVAKQWMWKIGHASGPREINTLHIPVGRPVRLTMISEDVIHSFYVPAFRVKRDVLPGRYSTMWFEPTKVGTYHLFCAEYCGTDHAKMIGQVIVQTPEDHAAWLSSQQTMTRAQRGRRLLESSGCVQCHGESADGEPRNGPSLSGIFGRRGPLKDGTQPVVDAAYIRRAILEPQSQVHAGFTEVMPSFAGKLDPEQILDITAYIESIADATGPLPGPGKTSLRDMPDSPSQENE